MSKTLYDKLWDEHVVTAEGDGTATIYIDRHLMHEVTSPQAFEGLRLAGRKPWRESSIVATADHNTPTTGWEKGLAGITDPIALLQVETLDKNMKSICPAAYFPFMDKGQGVIHVMGPEEGATLPGMTVVCGDSHTSTHGACAALAFGIGTSEVEHVLATQTLITKKNKNMLVRVEGKLGPGITGKDIALAVIGKIGTAGGTGCTIEFAGSAIRSLSMEGRMTLCNMAIEAGAKCALFTPDEKTAEYCDIILNDYQKSLVGDQDATYCKVMEYKAEDFVPVMACPSQVDKIRNVSELEGTEIDQVFIGSCTNGRLEDLAAAAEVNRQESLAGQNL